MKKMQVTFENTTDTTGYLFSLAKCLSATLQCSPYEDYAEDIVASSGFAFRMWVAPDLCPSATSIWDFSKQKHWVENGGLTCDYVERLWHEEAVTDERREEALAMIKHSIEKEVAVVAWDISGCEWGIITGYDDEASMLYTLKVDGSEDGISYDKLGQLEIPILSVLAVAGQKDKEAKQIVEDTKKLAASHLRGEEWCENTQGLAAYDALIEIINNRLSADLAWNLEYYLGTYGALKWYAWKFFEKYGEKQLAELYQTIYQAWQSAFDCVRSGDVTAKETKAQLAQFLQAAKEVETQALLFMAE